ncbi:M48 family metallopeptidase [Solirubrum puertoriconensis]|uniref:YgjP-like metallopeptidase domain-containing protein n=1 Tax=Solirubrum puertoriconensis TaxID=1751427 RepID=A0A9X0L4P3_SOLP1|nr:SprT family zinc-dependent metalloprotease [Solirubrum puertoriconensis]KUG07809.1 hypothetical protein ASU33_16005 [Solirubrum puertoriconensis]
MPQLLVDNLAVEVVRKNIRTLRLTVYAPDGRVRVAVPLRTPEEDIRQLVVAREPWIRKHQERFRQQTRPLPLQYQAGETHYYLGQAYTLQLHTTTGTPHIVLEGSNLHLHEKSGTTAPQRQQLLTAWYRARLKEQLPILLAHWEPIVGAQAREWGVKQMKTRWGTCNIRAKRIWLNLELVKHPPHCLAYVVVHELVHLHERLHNSRFWGLMDEFMPNWRQFRNELNQHSLRAGHSPDAC